MPPFNPIFLRFLLTFGLSFLLILLPFVIFYKPLRIHVIETQQITASKAKSCILGYQTPNFKKLAQNLLNGHVFTAEEIDNYRTESQYLSFFKKGSELFPDLFEMYYMLGVCNFWIGNLPSAEIDFQKSLEINPVFFWSYYNLGLLYLKKGQIDAATALFSMAKCIYPQTTEKFLHDNEAFGIILQYMPNPGAYIHYHLLQANKQLDYLLKVTLAIRSGHHPDAPFAPDHWYPVFF